MVKRLARGYVRPYAGAIGGALFFMIIAAAMTALFAKLIEPVLNNVLVDTNRDLILPAALGMFVCFLVRGGATYIHTIIMNRVSQSIVADMQRDLFAAFVRLDLSFFHANPSGALVSRVLNDVEVVRQAIAGTFLGFGKSLLTLVFLIVLMFWQDWKLSLIALVIFPFAALFAAKIGRRLRKISKTLQAERGALGAVLTQIFQGIRQVKAYGAEGFEKERCGGVIDKVKGLNVKSVRVATLSTPFNETLVGLAVMGIILYGGFQVMEGRQTAGALLSFIGAFALAYEPMKKLATLNNTLQTGLGAAERVFDMLDRVPAIQDREDAQILRTEEPEIRFDHVSFSYGGKDEPALDDVSLVMAPGSVTALVGPSGGGKTTILNMIPRFYDPAAGAVRIDGADIRDLTLESLRAHAALVSQDITIFDDTVAANIAYGMSGATREAIESAAKAAAADGFIAALPEGYETRLGEQGMTLSGGQRQRI
ncbi:MAG: ABC transporter ATP-binding protein, partial [Alphaproteobacteria bacterium]|nr:ABC transporter ATP-binding protein [Alphaproteobacteria bacterium]